MKAMTSESVDKQGSMEKALADMRAELDHLVKEKNEVGLLISDLPSRDSGDIFFVLIFDCE